MGKYRCGAALMGPGHALQRRDKPVHHLLCRLGPRHTPQVGPPVEVVHLLRVSHVQLMPGVVLPLPHADLPERRLQMQRQGLGQPDGPCGDLRPVQVAAVHRVDVHLPEPLPQSVDLLIPPVVGDQPVAVAVCNAVQVSLRLRVADQIQPRHTTVTHCFHARTASSTAAAGSAAYCKALSAASAP